MAVPRASVGPLILVPALLTLAVTASGSWASVALVIVPLNREPGGPGALVGIVGWSRFGIYFALASSRGATVPRVPAGRSDGRPRLRLQHGGPHRRRSSSFRRPRSRNWASGADRLLAGHRDGAAGWPALLGAASRLRPRGRIPGARGHVPRDLPGVGLGYAKPRRGIFRRWASGASSSGGHAAAVDLDLPHHRGRHPLRSAGDRRPPLMRRGDEGVPARPLPPAPNRRLLAAPARAARQ